MPEDNNDTQFDLQEVVEVAPNEVSDEQKAFLQENVGDLTDDQIESFGLKKIPPPPAEPEVRRKPPAKKDEEPPAPPDVVVDPEDEATIGNVVDRRIQPLKEQLERQTNATQEQVNATEVDDLIREKPEYAPYRSKILTYMRHPDYSNIPAENIVMMPNVAGDDLMKIGAKKEREAAEEARRSKEPGSGGRPLPEGSKDWLKASDEEFQSKLAEVRGMEV